MGRDSSTNPQGLRFNSIEVNAQWAADATRSMLRRVVLEGILRELLEELPPERQAYWKFRRRGIDATIRMRYYGHQLDKSNNGTTRFIYPKDTANVEKGKP